MAHGDAPQESVARANLGVLAFYAGRWAEAVEWLTTSSRVAIEAGNDFGAAETDLTFADILIHQGHLDQAEEVLRKASRVLRASGIEGYAAHGQMLQARIHLARGELATAEEQAVGAVAEFTAMGSAVDALEASLVRAEVAIGAGRPHDALAIVDQAHRAAPDDAAALEARSQLVRSRALLLLGLLDEAGTAITAGLAAALEQELPFEEALLLRARSQWRAALGGRGAAAQPRCRRGPRHPAAGRSGRTSLNREGAPGRLRQQERRPRRYAAQASPSRDVCLVVVSPVGARGQRRIFASPIR